MEDLFTYLDSISALGKNAMDFLVKNVKWIEIPKWGFVLKEGHVRYNIYFIKKKYSDVFKKKRGD